MLNFDLDRRSEGDGISVCPGPNMAYFNEEMSLKTINDHIYGKQDVLRESDRPHFFINELVLYMNYLENIIKSIRHSENTEKETLGIRKFIKNMFTGVEYYESLFSRLNFSEENIQHLQGCKERLQKINLDIQ